jgi:gas vesicle protein
MNEQELAAVQEERGKLYDAVSKFKAANKEQSNIIAQLKIDLNDAQNRVRDLAEQLNRIHNTDKKY